MCLLAIIFTLASAVSTGVHGANHENDSFYTCIPGLKDNYGVSFPRGQTSKPVGSDPFPLTCHLDPSKGSKSDSLKFFKKIHSDSHFKEVELSSRILNETTIEAIFDPSEVGSFMVDCRIVKDNTIGVCTQTIFVGSEPLPPENFNCISYNWQNLNCTWTEPANPVKSKYDLSYKDNGNYGRISCEMMHPKTCSEEWCDFTNGPTGPLDYVDYGFACTKKFSRFFKNLSFTLERKNMYGSDIYRKDYENMFVRSASCPRNESGICIWDLKTEPMFRQTLKNFEMVFNVTNQLKPDGKIYPFKYFLHEIVKPKPVNMTLDSLDPRTILINYTIDTNLHYFPPGFRQQIKFQSEYQSSWTVERSDLVPESLFYEFNLTNLDPYTEYKVEVRILSRKANESDERLWSDPTSLLIKTQAVAPFTSPKVDIGSFEVSEDRSLFVYWKPLARQEQNGPDFSYSVDRVNEDGSIIPINLVEEKQSYAKFGNISRGSYTFLISSKNSKGKSPTPSKLYVPSEKDRNIQPTAVTKVAFNGTLFEVSWQPPYDPQRLVRNYTVFWCKPKNKRDRPYQCDGELDWMVVNDKEQNVNVTLPSDSIYQVAVAANTDLGSSGMVWSTCTILHDKVTNTIRKFRMDMVSSRSLRVSWRFDCSKRIRGYKIAYCSLSSMDSSKCAEEEKYVIAQPTSELYELEGLNPWTVYMVSIMATSPGGDGPRSEYLKNKTLVESPEKPESLEITEVKMNRTLQLSWQPPKKLNGHIDFYKVEYSFSNFLNKWESEKKNSSGLSLDISGVEVYTTYEISVCACTKVKYPHVMCGHECLTETFQTGIGNSSVMTAPQAIFVNSTVVEVSWNASNFHKGGPDIEYEIRLVYQHTKNQHIFTVSPPSTHLEINLEKISDEKDWSPNCQNATSWANFYNFSVRAVTIDKTNDLTYHSMWSDNEIVPAFCSNSLSTATIISLSIIIPAFVFCLLVVSFKFFFWGNRTFGIFKDVSKEVTQNNRSKDFSFRQESVELNNTEMNGYLLTKSRDCTQGLLDQHHRVISGTSDTTSGCDSGGPSCDESEETEQPIMLMSEDSLANYQKKYENQTTSDLSSVTTPITDLENNQQGNHVHVSLSNPLRFNPLQQNLLHCSPNMLRLAGGSVTVTESSQRLKPTPQYRTGSSNNGYVSLPNVCQLAKPNSIKTFKLDPSFFDFDSIPPPKLPTPDKKENSKSTLPQENRTKEEIQEVKEEEAELHESNYIKSAGRNRVSALDQKAEDSPASAQQPRELHVTAVQSAHPKTVIVTSCDTLFKDRQSTMV